MSSPMNCFTLKSQSPAATAVPLTAAQHYTAFVSGFLYPAFQPYGILFGNNRANKGVLFFRVPDGEILDLSNQFVPEFGVDFLVNQNPLDTDTALSGLIKSAEYHALYRVINIGILPKHTPITLY